MLSKLLDIYRTLDPSLRVAGTLGAILLLHGILTAALTRSLLVIVVTLLIDRLLAYGFRRPQGFPFSALVTGLLLALITPPQSAWYIPVVAAGLAIGSKYVLRFRGRHIFNPAGFGLLVTGLLVGPITAWWGVSGPTVLRFLLIAGMGLILWQLKRLSVSLLFFGGYFLVLLLLLHSLAAAVRATLDPTVLLFGLVMVPEPMTSPNRAPWLWVYSVALLGSLVLQLVFRIYLPDVLLGALLVANLFASLRYRPMHSVRQERVVI